MDQILDKACDNGDLTPEGVSKAKDDSAPWIPWSRGPADHQDRGVAERRELHLPAADVPGGAKAVSEKFVGDDVAGFMNGG